MFATPMPAIGPAPSATPGEMNDAAETWTLAGAATFTLSLIADTGHPPGDPWGPGQWLLMLLAALQFAIAVQTTTDIPLRIRPPRVSAVRVVRTGARTTRTRPTITPEANAVRLSN